MRAYRTPYGGSVITPEMLLRLAPYFAPGAPRYYAWGAIAGSCLHNHLSQATAKRCCCEARPEVRTSPLVRL